MRFIKGFIFGSLVGFGIGSTVNEPQRRTMSAKLRRRAAPVGQAISDNVDQAAQAATERVVDAVDQAGDAVTDRIDTSEVDSDDRPTAAATS